MASTSLENMENTKSTNVAVNDVNKALIKLFLKPTGLEDLLSPIA